MTTAAEDRVLTRAGQDRRAHLLATAERLFGEHGYGGTTMAGIAREAGVAKGLVYWYWDGKEALFREVIQDVRGQLRTEQAQALAGVEQPLDRLFVGTRASVRHVAEHWQVYFRLQAADPSFERELGESVRVHADDALALVQAGQADGTVRDDEDAASLAAAVQGVANQAAVAHLRGRTGSLDDSAAAAARFVVRAVAARPDVADAVIARRG